MATPSWTAGQGHGRQLNLKHGLGTLAAVRNNARMLQHWPNKQTFCPSDCRPLECHQRTLGLHLKVRRIRMRPRSSCNETEPPAEKTGLRILTPFREARRATVIRF